MDKSIRRADAGSRSTPSYGCPSGRCRTAADVIRRLRGLLIGGPKNVFVPRIYQHLALIAFFAWVGLGSDGLSSSCYGPEEVFRQLGAHRHLALYLVVAMV